MVAVTRTRNNMSAVITLTTDLGLSDAYVATMYEGGYTQYQS